MRLAFSREHAELILEEKKIQTTRIRDQYSKYQKGDVVEFGYWEEKRFISKGKLKVVSCKRKQLKDFTNSDAVREGFKSLGDFVENGWNSVYETKWKPELRIFVIQFELNQQQTLNF